MKTFLEAEWKNLILINYEVPKELLEPYVPIGTEIDLWEGKAFVSLVAFMFDKISVFGIPAIGNRSFPEVNLRMYIKRSVDGEDRRAVAFIKEIVPKPLVTKIANIFFKEHYETCKMNNLLFKPLEGNTEIEYKVFKGSENKVSAEVGDELAPLIEESFEEFIAEHYWGYSNISSNKTVEYEVQHPRWSIFKESRVDFKGDFSDLYGEKWSFLNDINPVNCFVANGSEVKISLPNFLKV